MTTRPSGFEDRLKAALLARFPQEAPAPAPARSFARRYGIPLAVGIATAAVVAVMTLTGHGGGNGSLPARPAPSPTPSRAPKEPVVESDGTIVVALPGYDEVEATVERLRAMGVRVAFVQKKPLSECSHSEGGYVAGTGTDGFDIEAEVLRGRGDGQVLRINSKTVPEGHTLVLSKMPRRMLHRSSVGTGVKETAKVTPCEGTSVPSVEEEQRQEEEMRKALERLQGVPAAPPGGPVAPVATPVTPAP
ncbi:hypothetical protein ACFVFI_25920 [Streptomyces sp. NPDC057705]|uniref:hypothetical protein n=1 Tax=Streptomyces sp. NPDC057705 TaxID=3346222 RepID=UPI0036763D3C